MGNYGFFLPLFVSFLVSYAPFCDAQTPTTAPTTAGTSVPTPTPVTAAPTSVNGTVADDDYTEQSTCNITRYYEWYNEDYNQGLYIDKTLTVPKTDERWWDIVKYTQDSFFTLTNGHAMEVLGTKCRQYIKAINVGLAGKHGPVSEQAIYDVMCTEYCNFSDLLRVEALETSGCTCMDLSTTSDQIGYSRQGDWCRENSGKILCEELDRCGVWNCQLVDFECPRQEYNTINVELRGYAQTDKLGTNRGFCSGVSGIFGSNVRVLSLGLSLFGTLVVLV